MNWYWIVLLILAAWFLLSLAVSLILGPFLAGRTVPPPGDETGDRP